MIYFIEAGFGGPIKVGFAMNVHNLFRRLAEMQSTNPEELHLLLAMPGDIKQEGRLHYIFRECHIRGEWFNRGKILVGFIKKLRSLIKEGQSKDLPIGEYIFPVCGNLWSFQVSESGTIERRLRCA